MKRLKSNRLRHLAHGETFPTDKQKAAREELEREQELERRAAFGEGVPLINVITGERFTS